MDGTTPGPEVSLYSVSSLCTGQPAPEEVQHDEDQQLAQSVLAQLSMEHHST